MLALYGEIISNLEPHLGFPIADYKSLASHALVAYQLVAVCWIFVASTSVAVHYFSSKRATS